jgi:hypothetical protein
MGVIAAEGLSMLDCMTVQQCLACTAPEPLIEFLRRRASDRELWV